MVRLRVGLIRPTPLIRLLIRFEINLPFPSALPSRIFKQQGGSGRGEPQQSRTPDTLQTEMYNRSIFLGVRISIEL